MAGASNSRREFLKASGAAVALIGSGAFAAHATTDSSRIALVIGNNAYPYAPLGNAINDAKSVSALLTRAGFQVTLKTDVARDALRASAIAFGEAARKSDTKQIFFYYAGHGAQLDWRDYLVPVDAKVDTVAILPARCFELGVLLDDLSRAKGKVFVIILDACRDNPFGPTVHMTQKGLSQFDAPEGSLLAFSTAPGSVAADGRGSNGLYTENLVRELAVKGARLEDAFKRVRLAVRLASHGAQIPWESTSLESDVFLFPSGDKLSEAELEEQLQRELDTWNRIKGSKQPEDWVNYLREYPSGRFTEIAQTRLSYLLSLQQASALATAAPMPAIAAPALTAMGPPVTVPPPVAPPAAAAPMLAIAAPTLAAMEPPAALPVVPSASEPPPVLVTEAAFDLEIRAGLPTPVLMRPSENPLSVGTYPLNRRFSVGDEVVYTVSDTPFAPNRRTATSRVTRVDEEADRVEIDSGISIWDTMGNPYKSGDRIFEPRVQLVPAELQLGKRWTTSFRLKDPGKNWWESYYDYKVVGRERVKVPAGEFEAFKLEGYGWNKTTSIRLALHHWVVPGLNFQLKVVWIRYPRYGPEIGELRELVSCRQRRWSVA